MTPEELAAYVDPEKYHKFLVKCKEPNRKYYHSKQMRIEDELTNPTIVEI